MDLFEIVNSIGFHNFYFFQNVLQDPVHQVLYEVTLSRFNQSILKGDFSKVGEGAH